MKKLLFIACMGALVMASCTENKNANQLAGMTQNDSLNKIIEQKDNEINDMMGTLNEIQEGFRQISEAENRVSLMKDGEGANRAQQLRENIKFISGRMKENRELIEKLRQQMRESSMKGEQFKKTIESLMKQLSEKDRQLQQLRVELDSKDIHISELDETINNLNTDVNNLNAESTKKSEVINEQDKQLNTAWFVFGTKKELKNQRIMKTERCFALISTRTISPRLTSVWTRRSSSTPSRPSFLRLIRQPATRCSAMPTTSMCCASPIRRFSGQRANISWCL